MGKARSSYWLFGLWATLAVLLGAALMSLHQPFRPPQEAVLSLVEDPGHHRWRALHLLSGTCGCSQRVMQHLLDRPGSGADEQILIVDSGNDAAHGNQGYLPETPALLARLERSGFPITHISAHAIPEDLGLRGVPLLVVASPENKVVYMGGYGEREDKESEILAEIRAGRTPHPFPILGCAFSAALQHRADPLHLKYQLR